MQPTRGSASGSPHASQLRASAEPVPSHAAARQRPVDERRAPTSLVVVACDGGAGVVLGDARVAAAGGKAAHADFGARDAQPRRARLLAGAHAQRGHLVRPPHRHLRDEVRHALAMAYRMIGRQRREAGVHQRHLRAVAAWLERHRHRGRLVRREVDAAPFDLQRVRRIPRRDGAGLHDVRRLAAGRGDRLEQPAAQPRLQVQHAEPASADPELHAVAPPGVDLFGEDLEGDLRRRLDEHARADAVSRRRRAHCGPRVVRAARARATASACLRNACICTPQNACTSPSQACRSASGCASRR